MSESDNFATYARLADALIEKATKDQLADVARLLAATPDLDLGSVLDRAERIGGTRTVLLGVLLAHLMLDAPLEDEEELPEFERRVLDGLREPLESGRVVISRAARSAAVTSGSRPAGQTISIRTSSSVLTGLFAWQPRAR